MIRRTPIPRSTKPIARGKRPLRPVDGEFRSSVDERNKACAAAGHPLDFINLSMSRPGVEIKRCLCGEVDQSKPAKTRKRPNAKRPGPARRVSVVRDQSYMDWLKDKDCVACVSVGMLIQAVAMRERWSDPAHTDKTNGMRSKGSDASCIPLCRYHHQEMDGQLTTSISTKAKFAAKYNLDLAAIAAENYARFKQEQSK